MHFGLVRTLLRALTKLRVKRLGRFSVLGNTQNPACVHVEAVHGEGLKAKVTDLQTGKDSGSRRTQREEAQAWIQEGTGDHVLDLWTASWHPSYLTHPHPACACAYSKSAM